MVKFYFQYPVTSRLRLAWEPVVPIQMIESLPALRATSKPLATVSPVVELRVDEAVARDCPPGRGGRRLGCSTSPGRY